MTVTESQTLVEIKKESRTELMTILVLSDNLQTLLRHLSRKVGTHHTMPGASAF